MGKDVKWQVREREIKVAHTLRRKKTSTSSVVIFYPADGQNLKGLVTASAGKNRGEWTSINC